jgi:hypothetical protein
LVTQELDLSKSEDGLSNQIWVGVVRTAGADNVTVTLMERSSGSWLNVQPYRQAAQQVGATHQSITKFSGLTAARYKILLTAIAVGASWNVHVAHS